VNCCFALLHAWAQTDLDSDSICMRDIANVSFMNFDRAKAFMHYIITSHSSNHQELTRITSIPNLEPKALTNIKEMRKLFLLFQGSQKFKPNERFSERACKVAFAPKDSFKELMLLVDEFPEEGNIHYPLIAKFIISSDIDIFNKDDVERILSVVETLKGYKTFGDRDMTCIELLNQCMKIETHNEAFISDWDAHELQIAIITSLLDEHRQNISNFSTLHFTKK
jgi:hypothetical protein